MHIAEKSTSIYENKYHFLIDNILQVVGELDSRGIFTYVNPYIYDELGYQPKEVIGRAIFELIHPDDIKKIIKVLHGRTKFHGFGPEIRLKNDINQFIWFEIKTRRIKDFDRKIRIIITLINISKFKSLAKMFKEKQENYQNITKSLPEIQFWKVLTPKKYKGIIHATSEMLKVIIENIPQYIYWKDANLKFIGCNRNFTKFIGIDRPESIIGKTNEELFSNKKKFLQIREYENKIIQSGKPIYHTNEIWITAERKEIWLDINGVPLFDSDEKVIGVLITCEEITDRKIAEEKLSKSEEKYKNLSSELETILDIIPGMIFIKDKYDEYTRVNQVFADYLQLGKEEIIGKSTLDLFPQELATILRRDDFEVINSGLPKLSIEETINFPGGKVSAIISKMPSYNEKEEINGIIGLAIDISERRLAEKSARESQHLLENTFNTLNDAVFVLNAGNPPLILKCNHAAEKIFGYSIKEMLDKSTSFLHVDAATLEEFQRILYPMIEKGEDLTNFRFNMKRKNGLIFPSEHNVIPLKNEHGKLIGWVSVVRDITEQLEAQQKLEESEGKYRLISENANDLIVILDKNLKYEYINEQVHKKLMGYSNEDLLSKSALTFIHPDDFEEASKSLKEGFETGEGVGEARVRHKNGVYLWLEIKGKTFKDKNGIKKALLISRDITERKKGELKLKESEEKYRSLVEDAQEGVWAFDENDNTIFINPKICEMFGYTKDEMMGKNLLKFIPDSMRELIESNRKKRQKGIKETHDLQLIHKNGTLIYTNIKTTPIFNENRNYKGSFAYVADITQRKIAEQQLAESELKYRTLVEKSLQGICIIQDLKILFANKALTKILGYSIEELYSLSPEEVVNLIYIDDREFVFNRHKERLNGIYVLPHYEFRIIRKDNQVRWVDMFATLIEYEGKPAVQEVFIDITERKEVEEKLKESEKKYRNLIENLPDAIYSSLPNETSTTLFLSSRWKDWTGVPAEDFMNNGDLFFKSLHPDDTEIAFKEFNRAIEGGKEFILNYRVVNKNTGEEIFIRDHGVPVKNEQGNIIRYDGILTNITDLKKAERKLKESEEKYRNLVENAQEGVWAVDENDIIVFVNPKLCEMLGYPKDEMIGKNLHSFLEDQMIELINSYRKRREKGLKDTYDLEFIKKDGTIIYTSVKAAPILGEYGEFRGSFAYISDITSKKIMEQKLFESEYKYRNLIETSTMGLLEIDIKKGGVAYINPRLLKIVGYSQEEFLNQGMLYKIIYSEDYKKFTGPIEEKDIEFRVISKDGKIRWLSGRSMHNYDKQGNLLYLRLWLQEITEKKEVEEIKSNLLTRISHEFKTPLISIKGYSELLLTEYKKSLNKQTISFLERIREGGDKLKLLINRFIETTQLNKHLVKLNKSNENLHNLIKKGIAEIESLIKLRNHTINIDISDELVMYLDKDKIQTVISNLLTNAIKYTPSGGTITINSRIKKNSLIISVRDDGIGLQKEEIAQLFKPFGKIEKYGRGWDIISDGIGLGLYLSKEIIDLHEGKIWVESAGLNKGSTFYFLLPIIRNNITS